MHKSTTDDFAQLMLDMSTYTYRSANAPLIDGNVAAAVQTHRTALQAAIDYQRDYLLTFFSIKTLERSYLYKMDERIVERPQHMWMRVAVGIHYDPTTNELDVEKALETYHAMSQLYCTHATPTLFNASSLARNSVPASADHARRFLEGIFSTLVVCPHFQVQRWHWSSVHNIRGWLLHPWHVWKIQWDCAHAQDLQRYRTPHQPRWKAQGSFVFTLSLGIRILCRF